MGDASHATPVASAGLNAIGDPCIFIFTNDLHNAMSRRARLARNAAMNAIPDARRLARDADHGPVFAEWRRAIDALRLAEVVATETQGLAGHFLAGLARVAIGDRVVVANGDACDDRARFTRRAV